MKRILILYRELAGYIVACLHHLDKEYQVKVDVVAYPLNTDAPFHFSFSPNVSVEKRADHDAASLRKKIEENKYDIILVSGWADKDYLLALKNANHAIKIVGFDTWWFGTAKQQLASFYARLFIRPKFNFAFVPGEEQKRLAQHFGFSQQEIIEGIYSCDVDRFSAIFSERKTRKKKEIKTLMYVGRYAPEKFIHELCEAMIDLWNEGHKDWRLQCIGTGPLFESRILHEAIEHRGFRQPEELAQLMKEGDAFILPSTFEPWGVVVHEFAAAGFPLVLSDSVGSKSVFLKNGENGFLFGSGNKNEMRSALKKLFSSDQQQLMAMGEKSAMLARQITPDTWAKKLLYQNGNA